MNIYKVDINKIDKYTYKPFIKMVYLIKADNKEEVLDKIIKKNNLSTEEFSRGFWDIDINEITSDVTLLSS